MLDIPGMARDVLRRYAADRVSQSLPVCWYSDGLRRSAVPRPDKRPGAWLVSSANWETYYDAEQLTRELETADAVEVMQ